MQQPNRSGTGSELAGARERIEALEERAARPVPYAARDHAEFGAVRAAYQTRNGLPEARSAEPEAAP
jgi:hypothetical protein